MTLHLNSRRKLLSLAAALACGAALPLHAQTAAWPNKPIKLVVGYAAGGATDVIARIVGVKLGEQLGQSIVIDNRAGANSNIAAESVARAPAPSHGTPEQFRNFAASEVKRWHDVVKQSGAKAE